MKGFTLLLALCLAFTLPACSKEEAPPAPEPASKQAPKPSPPPASAAIEKAEQVAKQVEEKVEQVAKQVEEKTTAVVQQAKASLKSGQAIYTQSCMVCHKIGLAGAPKVGDKKDWSSRIARGTDSLVNNTIKGIGGMPPRGGNSQLTDAEIKAAVDYMVEQSQ